MLLTAVATAVVLALVPRASVRPVVGRARAAIMCGAHDRDDWTSAEDDWVKARIAAEDRDFHARRDAARSARSRVWDEEAGARREEEPAEAARRDAGRERERDDRRTPPAAVAAPAASVQFMITQRMRVRLTELGYSEADVNRLEPQRAADIIQAAATRMDPGNQQAVGCGEGAATMAPEEQARRNLDEYETRMRDAAHVRPKTEEEKREAYNRDVLAQIKEADAMDERLAQKHRAAQFHKTFRQERGLD
eukprot:5042023-Prymnesium_polylepis.2